MRIVIAADGVTEIRLTLAEAGRLRVALTEARPEGEATFAARDGTLVRVVVRAQGAR